MAKNTNNLYFFAKTKLLKPTLFKQIFKLQNYHNSISIAVLTTSQTVSIFTSDKPK
jgi:hypothetical protein